MKFCGILQLAALLALSEGLARPDEAVHDWSEEIAEGERASAAADYTQAAHAFERALQTAQKKGTVGELGVALASNDLANMCATLGRYREAEPLPQGDRHLAQGAGRHTPSCRDGSEQPCGPMRAYGTLPRGRAIIWRGVVRSRENDRGIGNPGRDRYEQPGASCTSSSAGQGEAAALFERALEMQESRGMPPDGPRIALTLRYMADVEMQRHDYDRAPDLYTSPGPRYRSSAVCSAVPRSSPVSAGSAELVYATGDLVGFPPELACLL